MLSNDWMKSWILRSAWLTALLLVAFAITAEAQNLGYRVVSGFVSDGHSDSVVGATVFLRDAKSKAIRSYTTVEKGRFRFAGVNMAEDHELWAEKAGKKSAVKTISSWDTRKEFEVELKLK